MALNVALVDPTGRFEVVMERRGWRGGSSLWYAVRAPTGRLWRGPRGQVRWFRTSASALRAATRAGWPQADVTP